MSVFTQSRLSRFVAGLRRVGQKGGGDSTR